MSLDDLDRDLLHRMDQYGFHPARSKEELTRLEGLVELGYAWREEHYDQAAQAQRPPVYRLTERGKNQLREAGS
jgi:hypothetical protein